MADYDLLKVPNVVGYGRGYKRKDGRLLDRQAVIVLVNEKLPEVMLSKQDMIPERLEMREQGLVGQTDVVQVGILRALRTKKHRPAPGGVSIGHRDITAGTFGVLVADSEEDQLLILSNNHVLANSNAGSKGDAIYQPGPADGGSQLDTIAQLERWVPIAFEGGCAPFGRQGPNLVDAALAKPLDQSDVVHKIIDIGLVMGTMTAALQQDVRKSGRTTALTRGTVQVIDAVVQVSYGSAGTAVFEQQIVTSNMSKGGDSGSLLVDGEKGMAVGLLFAGSDQVTIHNPINEVLRALKIVI